MICHTPNKDLSLITEESDIHFGRKYSKNLSNRSNSFLSDRFLCQDNAVLPVASVWGYGRTMQVRILVTCGGRKISFSWLLDLWSSCLLNRRSSWLFEERFSSPLSCPCPVPLTYRNCCFQTFRWVAGIFPSGRRHSVSACRLRRGQVVHSCQLSACWHSCWCSCQLLS